MCLSKIIAKKKNDKTCFQSLNGHTLDLLIIFKDYLSKNLNVVEQFSENWNVNYDDLCSLIFLSIFLHDIGKMTKEFQGKISKGEHCGNFSHPFFGLPFVNTNLPEKLNNILRLIVLSHHSQLYNRIYEDARLAGRVIYLKDEIRDYISQCDSFYSTNEFAKYFILKYTAQYKLPDYLNNLELKTDIYENEICKLKYVQVESFNLVDVKAIYSYVLSILKYCDQEASEYFGKIILDDKFYSVPLYDLKENKPNYTSNIFDKVQENLFKFEPYRYQIEASQIDYNGIIFAPCGRGKTEASLNAAIKILKKHNKDKIIFALPTQLTSNAMYRRFKKDYDIENTNIGIYHGLSRFVHKIKNSEITEDDINEVAEDSISTIVRKEKVFRCSIMITTIDHLIYSLVHGYKQADYALGSILNAVIIFDEIHYYNTNTLRYIVEALGLLRDLKIPHIIMSGTLPSNLLNELSDCNYTYIEDEEGLKFRPFQIQRINKKLNDSGVIEQIVDHWNKGVKQIIILNTVSRVQDLYNLLKGKVKNLIIYHSMLTHYDRAYGHNNKEKEILSLKNTKINEPWIIVSTQAIEISVNISCDIMHTEIAPVDAIGQRGGRLNRGGKDHKNKFKMFIYDTENYKPYFFQRNDEINFVAKTENILQNGEITYLDFKKMCDSIYGDVSLSAQNLKRVFKKCILFGYSPKEIRYSEEQGNYIKLRETKFLKRDIMPECYWRSDLENKEIFMVKVPAYWYQVYPDCFYIADDKYTICTIPYSREYGFDLTKIQEEDKSCLIT